MFKEKNSPNPIDAIARKLRSEFTEALAQKSADEISLMAETAVAAALSSQNVQDVIDREAETLTAEVVKKAFSAVYESLDCYDVEDPAGLLRWKIRNGLINSIRKVGGRSEKTASEPRAEENQ